MGIGLAGATLRVVGQGDGVDLPLRVQREIAGLAVGCTSGDLAASGCCGEPTGERVAGASRISWKRCNGPAGGCRGVAVGDVRAALTVIDDIQRVRRPLRIQRHIRARHRRPSRIVRPRTIRSRVPTSKRIPRPGRRRRRQGHAPRPALNSRRRASAAVRVERDLAE